MTNQDRLDLLVLAREMGFHGDGGCCGFAALAINEVLFENKGKIVIALNKALLERDEDFFGHVGVLDEKGVIWDYETVYVGYEGFEDFKDWGMVAPGDPKLKLTPEEAEGADVYILDSLAEAREVIGTGSCHHGDLNKILRTARNRYFEAQA